MNNKVKITIECEEEQLNLMIYALEEYVRLHIGQVWMLTDDLAHTNEVSNNDREFYRRCNIRNETQEIIESAIRRLRTATGYDCKTDDDTANAQDLYMGFRYCRFNNLYSEERKEELKWTTEAYRPLHLGKLPLAKIDMERIE